MRSEIQNVWVGARWHMVIALWSWDFRLVASSNGFRSWGHEYRTSCSVAKGSCVWELGYQAGGSVASKKGLHCKATGSVAKGSRAWGLGCQAVVSAASRNGLDCEVTGSVTRCTWPRKPGCQTVDSRLYKATLAVLWLGVSWDIVVLHTLTSVASLLTNPL